ncbi:MULTISPECIES: alpha/beta hydrolase [unclassified Mesorhizobium]|uniref:alpha/beta hydrolase n=1 Tax=unclassified Mesorhizobium TaxID=325217 RepID=UPI000BB00CF6|nr:MULTISPECIES: alpha/beta hydrolase [unclassified Mesorhizobium]PBC21288.1 alpha/beta hydrolase [Mesorhizobium sp. WSM4311]TRD04784.1 alpha/beta hydrolase [Mesorhizobium sp. WSM4305]
MKRAITGLLAAMIATASALAASAAEKAVSIVLVHGAFVDASGWQAVHDILSAEGYEVLAVQNPTVTLEGDVEATRQVIARAKKPVVLVGHSYGGAVITEAGDLPKVQSLVYLAAFAPQAGESVFDIATVPTPGEDKAPLLPPSDGFLLVDSEKFPAAFAAEVDPTKTRFMADAQVPWGLGAVQAKITAPAWKDKPTYFMVTTGDHMIPPSQQRAMAARAKAKVVEIDSSHAVMLSHPQEVADFIAGVAAQTN